MTVTAPQGLPAKGTTKYISVAGTDLPLPPGSRPDLATTVELDLGNYLGQAGFVVNTVPGDYYEVPLVLSFGFTTGSTEPISNTVVFATVDGEGNEQVLVPASVQQPPATRYRYLFAVGYGNAYSVPAPVGSDGDNTALCVAGLPPLLLVPGYTWQAGLWLPPDMDFNWINVFAQSIQIPSGSGSIPARSPSIRLV